MAIPSHPPFEIVALAASAGGLRALSEVLAVLPASFPAAMAVVQHLDPRHRSLMADILSRRTPLTVKEAEAGEVIRPGGVYVAPPNQHLLVNSDRTVSLAQTELVHFVRPSADLLFESVAASFKDQTIAVVLTGTGSDGIMGVQAIKKMGGEEFTFLFNTILINVTSCFRDSAHWDYLAAEILPRILAGKTPGDSIRVWSAGCASGQEAYTLAMLLAEPLGEEEFRRQVKIYATDVDEEALNEARQGSYSQHQVEDVPQQYLDKYFEHGNGRYNFHKELRRSVIFGRHDLIQDAPISRVDLLVCRNTLMYFNAEAQSKILSRFDFALNGGSFLFLGKAEVLLTRSQAFAPVDLKRRVFATVPNPRPRDCNRLPETSAEEALGLLVDSTRVHEAALETNPVPHIIVDRNGTLTFANEQARLLFGLPLANV
ncbi:MAG: CheR family methyltransferase, partial [Anaerolineales bacterium]